MSVVSNRLIKVLIVDDDRILRRLMTKLIQDSWPIEIIEAEDGLEALTILLKHPPHLNVIILDLMMPLVNGIEVLKLIRSRPKFDRVPIMVCTVVNDVQQIKQIIKHGVDDYVVKPIDRVVFLRKFFRILRKIR
ncbi:MAG: PleD family two-component system response regulator [bacterium]